MVFYLAVVIWLGSWVMSFAFTLVLFFVIAYSLWLALMWQAMLQSSLHGLCVRGSGDKTSCKLTMTVHVTYLDLERGQCSYFQSLVPRFHHFQIWLLTICEANDGFIPWVQYPHFQPLPPPVSANTEILWVAKVHVAKRAIKNWWWESSGMPRNENQHIHLARSTETKTLHLHFHFQFPFPVSISSLSSSFHFQFTFPVYVSIPAFPYAQEWTLSVVLVYFVTTKGGWKKIPGERVSQLWHLKEFLLQLLPSIKNLTSGWDWELYTKNSLHFCFDQINFPPLNLRCMI